MEVPLSLSMPMFPLSTVLFPGESLDLHIFELRYRTMISECLASDSEFGVVLISRGSEVGGGESRFDIGAVAHIERAIPHDDGRFSLAIRGVQRLRVIDWFPDNPYPRALVERVAIEDIDDCVDELAGATSALRKVGALLSELGQEIPSAETLELDGDAETASFRLCSMLPLNLIDRQHLLETNDVLERLAMFIDLSEDLSDTLLRLLSERSED